RSAREGSAISCNVPLRSAPMLPGSCSRAKSRPENGLPPLTHSTRLRLPMPWGIGLVGPICPTGLPRRPRSVLWVLCPMPLTARSRRARRRNMNLARDLIADLARIGATVKPAGDRLILRAGYTAIPATLVNRIREAKADLIAILALSGDRGRV